VVEITNIYGGNGYDVPGIRIAKIENRRKGKKQNKRRRAGGEGRGERRAGLRSLLVLCNLTLTLSHNCKLL
jgi:hypothetical protein